MAIRKDQLFQEALHLDDDERVALAAALLESLEPENDEGVEAAWLQEIERRMSELDSGQVEPQSWEQVKEKLYNVNA